MRVYLAFPLALALTAAGCGTATDSVNAGSATSAVVTPTPVAVATTTLRLIFAPPQRHLLLAGNAGLGATATFTVQVYQAPSGPLLTELVSVARTPANAASQDVPLGGLPQGNLILRVIFFDASGATLGYQEQTFANGSVVMFDSLIPGPPPPVGAPSPTPTPTPTSLPSPAPAASPSPVASASPSPLPAASPSPTPQALTLHPAQASLAPGGTQAFQASAPGVTFSSSAPTVVVVSSAGLATAVGGGTAQVVAALGGTQASADVSVSGPALQALALSPASFTLTVPATAQFTATGRYSDGTTRDLSSLVTWTSSSAGTATVSATGLVRAVSGAVSGTPVTVSASLGTLTAQAQGSVNAQVVVPFQPPPAPPPSPKGRLYTSDNVGPFNITIFSGARAFDSGASPLAVLQGATSQLNTPNLLAVDSVKDILYVPENGQVNIFGNASALAGVPVDVAPTKVITGFGATSGLQCLIDTGADRLFLSCSNGSLYQWDNISQNPAPTEANRSRVLTGVGANPVIALDSDHDRLFLSNSNDLILYVYDNASGLSGVASGATRRQLTAFTVFGNHPLAYDPQHLLLYASSTPQGSVEVFFNPGAAPAGLFPPVRTITGLPGAFQGCLDPATDDFYLARKSADEVDVLPHVSAQDGPAAVSRRVSAPSPTGLDIDFSR